MNRKDKQSRFGVEMQEALQENNDFVQDILSHSSKAAADVLLGASHIGVLAIEFARNVGEDDPLRQQTNDASRALIELIKRELQDKSPLAVANAFFWAAARIVTVVADDCPEFEEEEEEFANARTVMN